MRSPAFAALLALAACGHHAGLSAGSVAPLGLTNALPQGAPRVTPGEHMTYRLALQGLALASYEISVGDAPATIDGKQAILVQAHARSVGLANLAVKVDDYFSSWIDVATGRPLRWQADEFAHDTDDKEHVEARLSERVGDRVPMTFHLNDAPPIPEPQKVSQVDVWDYNAFLVALRSWEGAVGSKIAVEVLRSRYLWHVEMTIAKREQLVTELGAYPALRLDARSYKLTRDGLRDPDSDERRFTIWISDDDGRVPLQIVARTDWGDMEMKIVDYQAGNGARLRN
ncbi:MAG: DUF3108 domain-containing protein [Proteobacteria bacterium]|nr:DUF3108 domain-containing protein [Pseudomonadota bacterium]